MPFIVKTADGLRFVEHHGEAPDSFGRMCAFHGQMGMFTRALAYILSHGADGLRQVAEDAVLNANYILARLKPLMSPGVRGLLHARGAVLGWLPEGHGVETIDIAKGLIDEGYHPMTMYFPLVVHGAMLIEPTETESKAELDRFCDALASIARRAVQKDPSLKSAPHLAPAKRLDETRAARSPRLKWTPEAPTLKAAKSALEQLLLLRAATIATRLLDAPQARLRRLRFLDGADVFLAVVNASAAKSFVRPAFFRAAARSFGDLDLARRGVEFKCHFNLVVAFTPALSRCSFAKRQHVLAAHDGDRAAIGVAFERDGDLRLLALAEPLDDLVGHDDARGVHALGLHHGRLEFRHGASPDCSSGG